MKKLLQNIAIYILKKTKYQFRIEHNKFDIELYSNEGKVSKADKIGGYYFLCKEKNLGYLNGIEMYRYFYVNEMFDVPNPKSRGVIFDERNFVNLQKTNYEKIINEVKKSSRVIL